jgi:hypothetical protein
MNERAGFRGAGVVLLVAGLVGWTAVAAATPSDDAEPGDGGLPAEQTEAPVSDAKLRQFALAAANVQAIQQEYASEAETLKNETEARIVDSVEEAGMTVDEFKHIFQQVQGDPALAQRLDELAQP